VMWSKRTWFMWSDFVLKWSGVTVKFFGTKVSCTLGWPYTECTWLYFDHFIWCISCTVVVLVIYVHYLRCFLLFVLCFLYCFAYVYLFLFVLSVLVEGLLPPSDNSIAVRNNNNNNNKAWTNL
jgi:hypothetical protein